MTQGLLDSQTLTIGITTFRRRLPILRTLVAQLRRFLPGTPILITVNADYGNLLDEDYRRDLLELCAGHSGLFPFVFPTFTSLAKMWNTLIVNAPTSHLLIFNDDLEISGDDFYRRSLAFVQETNGALDPVHDLFTLNGTWSHFGIGKKLAHRLGYFDERLLAFGEEDGDFFWRFIDEFGFEPTNLEVQGIVNTEEGYRIQDASLAVEDRGQAFRPIFNRTMVWKKYKVSERGHKGRFGERVEKVVPDLSQYPYEEFKWTNFPNLGSGREIVLETKPNKAKFRFRFLAREVASFLTRAGRKLAKVSGRGTRP